ncbi:MAG: serine/threonine-protein kinase, partial [Planctomycetota bacterium]
MTAECPARAELANLVSGKSPSSQNARLEQHIAACVACQNTLDSLTSPIGTHRSADVPDSNPLRVAIDALKKSGLSAMTLGRNHDATHPRFPAEHSRTPQPVKEIGRYQLVREIGRGAMGRLFEGLDPQLNRTVAIKVLHEQADSPDSRERLLREARATVSLDHPGIVRVHDILEQSGQPTAIVMEYMRNGSVAEMLESRQLTQKQCVELVRQAAEGVGYAHENQLIHRDIKPSNLLIESENERFRICVADFGLVSMLETDSKLTRTGELAGTPAYMSPEQIETPSDVGAQSDIYSLGCVLYELLTGKPPFQGTVRMILWQVLNEYPKPPSLLDDRIPKQLEAICLKCLEKNPERRYTTANELAEDLTRFLSGENVHAKPP